MEHERRTSIKTLMRLAGGLAPMAAVFGLELAHHTAEHEGLGVSALFLGGALASAKTIEAIYAGVHAGEHIKQSEEHEAAQERLVNGDIARAVGKVIAKILNELASDTGIRLTDSERQGFRNIAVSAGAVWEKLAQEGGETFNVLRDQGAIDAITIAPGSPDFPLVGETSMWRDILEAMIESEGLTTAIPTKCDALTIAVAACRKDFAHEFYQELKHDFKHDGRAYAAVHLRMMGGIASGVASLAATQEEIGQRLDVILEAIDAKGASVVEASKGRKDYARVCELALRLDTRITGLEVESRLVRKGQRRLETVLRECAAEIKRRNTVEHKTTRRGIRFWSVGGAAAVIAACISLTAWNNSSLKLAMQHELKAALSEKAIPAPDMDRISPSVPTLKYTPAQLAAADAAIKADEALTRARGHIIRREFALADIALAEANAGRADPFELNTISGDRFYFDDMPDRALVVYRTAYLARPQSREARSNLAVALTFARELPVQPKRREAMEILRGLVREYSPDSQEWAMSQTNLGNILSSQTIGDLDSYRREAVSCFRAALKVRTRAINPTGWATTQNSLGATLLELTNGHLTAYREEAVSCFRLALEVRTRTAEPFNWAMTKGNLGNALRMQSTGDSEQNRLDAIACYREAEQVLTREVAPMKWAMLQNSLGVTLKQLTSGEHDQNLQDAIKCFRGSLEVRSREDDPSSWAMTQSNLGNALADLSNGDLEANREAAIACYRAALTIYTRDADPSNWAMTMTNLGSVLVERTKGDVEGGIREAITGYRAVLEVRVRSDNEYNWALTTNNLGEALKKLAAIASLSIEDREKKFAEAVDCYRAALEVFSKSAYPNEFDVVATNLTEAQAALDALTGR